jgi:hypothetical protein
VVAFFPVHELSTLFDSCNFVEWMSMVTRQLVGVGAFEEVQEVGMPAGSSVVTLLSSAQTTPQGTQRGFVCTLVASFQSCLCVRFFMLKRCMQKGTRRKCRCDEDWSGLDCSKPMQPEFDRGEMNSSGISTTGGDVGNSEFNSGVHSLVPNSLGGDSGGVSSGATDDGGGGQGMVADATPVSPPRSDRDDGGGGDDDASNGARLPLPGPLGDLAFADQLKALGAVFGLIVVFVLALCSKRRCAKPLSAEIKM